jgi:thiol-disulfide isomerase/thioredoxin
MNLYNVIESTILNFSFKDIHPLAKLALLASLIVLAVAIYKYTQGTCEGFSGDVDKGVIFFYSHTCPHCKDMIVPWEKLVSENTTELRLSGIESSESRDVFNELQKKYNVTSVPTMLCVKNGVVLDRLGDNDRTYSGISDFITASHEKLYPS